jgi:hypothetical protein
LPKGKRDGRFPEAIQPSFDFQSKSKLGYMLPSKVIQALFFFSALWSVDASKKAYHSITQLAGLDNISFSGTKYSKINLPRKNIPQRS